MKLIDWIDKYGMRIYFLSVLLAVLFHMAGFELINKTVISLFQVLYFLLLAGALFSFYKSSWENTNDKGSMRNNKAILFCIFPIFLLFSGIPLKVVTMCILIWLFFLKGIHLGVRILGILLYTSFILLGVFGLCLGPFGSNTVIDRQSSPNGIYQTVTIDHDQGALGGSTIINLERHYYGIAKRTRKIYSTGWGAKPTVVWVNNEIVSIDGKKMNIQKDVG